MTGSRDQFRHDRSRYERPPLGWRCGRAVAWGRPCERGPRADGTCPHGDAPCAPRRMHAQLRGRIALAAAALVLALVVILAGGFARDARLPSSLDAGPLSPSHAAFLGEEGCSSCHAAHGRGATAWISAALAALRPGGPHAIDGACTTCHGFDGRESLAHNAVFEKRADLPQTSCVACHAEHRGASLPASAMPDAQCQSCHARQFHGFAAGHPPFSPWYPSASDRKASFDHASHISKHFADPRNAEFVPAGQCLGCHQPQKQGGAVATLGYEAACAGCHDQGIARRDLVVMRWPELEPAPQAPEACGPPGDAPDPSPVSLDPANALLAFLLGAAADDQAAYADPLRKLADAMVAKGAEPIAALAAGRLGGDGARLLRGLSGETARMAACAWASNREHEPPGGATQPGWRAEGLEIRYARPAHGDPVVRAWLDAIAASPRPADDDDAERLEAVRAEILGADGPGQCLKCHAISGPADGPRTIAWNRSPAPQRQLHRFDHRPHVAAMPDAGSCASCHLQGDKPASSGFVPVGIEACTSCHQQGKAPDGCLTCHAYHQNHALKPRMTKDAR